ncbi:type II toxin-antitoxin system Phd/YefM family antitoxin [Endozoicomonas sp. SM1973]|uniref:Antitoxin n=1 Tax=Spartinivicinus marinus TaxID=2994442 RepID=A0A853I3S4_9GAMM|nr:type II toxin-antitoxin system Phd/YefM family antitoxin [Spartinivicinus marinus]MCX4026777.1 type II toxin-antitoxin system Phd/YefM family antitoxin [Spartinivicinus marinus]NYZ64611.1 type II toxin-antitoxin system Phd/YefM family antitoxin [Spartinivicinus marinus]
MPTTTNEWQLQEAKNKLSKLIKDAGNGLLQYITVHGKQTAVVLSVKEYERLMHSTENLYVYRTFVYLSL